MMGATAACNRQGDGEYDVNGDSWEVSRADTSMESVLLA